MELAGEADGSRKSLLSETNFVADCSPENFPWNQNSRIFQMVRTMNFGSVSPDPPKGHKNLDNCVRDETRAIHSVPHMQAGGQLARENGFFVSNNGPVAPSAISASRSSPRPPSSETSLGRSRTPVHRPGLLRSSIERPRATLSGRERGASPPRKTTMFASRGILPLHHRPEGARKRRLTRPCRALSVRRKLVRSNGCVG